MLRQTGTLFMAALLAAPLVFATKEPFPQERAAIDRLYREAAAPGGSTEAVRVLRAIVETGRPAPVATDEFLARIGVTREILSLETFQGRGPREYAIDRLIALPDAEEQAYMEGVAGDRSVDFEVREHALLGAWKLRVSRTEGGDHQVDLLEQALQARMERMDAGNVQSWAAEELSDRASLRSLPAIEQSIRNRDSSERGEAEIRL